MCSKNNFNQFDHRPGTLGSNLVENLISLLFVIVQKVKICQLETYEEHLDMAEFSNARDSTGDISTGRLTPSQLF